MDGNRPDEFAPLLRAIETFLEDLWPADDGRRLTASLRRAILSPGKRVRPLCTLLTARSFGAELERALPFAAAVELIHAASLVLDDLPAMDDAATRRGQPTLHRAIGEADATLVAFALIARAFRLAAEIPGNRRRDRTLSVELVGRLEHAVGAAGMCEGQSRDLHFDAAPAQSLDDLVAVHEMKTGALFAAAILGGARLAGAKPRELAALERFGKNLGLAFQVRDDILDHDGDTADLGKPVRADDGRRRTFVTLYGVEASRRVQGDLHRAAREALVPLGRRGVALDRLAESLERRKG